MKIEDDMLKLPLIGVGPAYEGVQIWLPQLILEAAQRGEAVITGKTFRNCFLEGPAVLLAVGGCRFDNCNMGDAMGDTRNLLLAPVGPQKVTGTVTFSDCSFVDCRFLRVGFTGAPEFLANIQQVLGGAAA
ncbi:hypothetical protein ER13_15990 [Brevundimonas sp. EAKA]|uniref:hypothetical protein n=1 Tax=Brevundimonas sp. EAKA TaxID=1495854 RepID=UPI0004A95D1A|nr:hypothetical protein [Brevundimonas sp. EAKA]KDP93822.1 hypothetical protein ER13_15990 [Brevundimonas sp. EAKA]